MPKRVVNLAILFFSIVLCWLIGYAISRATNFQLMGKLVNQVDTDKKIIALSLDDGPTSRTDAVLAILAKHQVKATFFLNGEALAHFPEEAKKIAQAGHEIGNHAYHHQPLVWVGLEKVKTEIEKTDSLIREAGYTDEIYIRPPFGKKLFNYPYYAWQNNRTTVIWSVAPENELGKGASAEEFAAFTVNKTQAGDIILMHVMKNDRNESLKAIDKMIPKLKSKGFQWVTISELLRHKREQN